MLNWSWDTGYNSRIDMGGGDTAHKNRFGHCTKFRIRGGDTAQENMFRYLYWGGDTAHNTTYYSESGGDTAQENVLRCSY